MSVYACVQILNDGLLLIVRHDIYICIFPSKNLQSSFPPPFFHVHLTQGRERVLPERHEQARRSPRARHSREPAEPHEPVTDRQRRGDGEGRPAPHRKGT